MTRSLRIAALLATTTLCAAVAFAGETITYSYDDLGRLVRVSYAGTVNNNQIHSTCFDENDNRTRYRSDPAGAGATCPEPVPAPTGTPPPPPPPAPNNPPVANTDVMNVQACVPATASLVVNDTDPDGDALTIVSVTTSSIADVYILTPQTISVSAYPPNPYNHGWINYTISDGRGGTATGSVHIIIGGSAACQ